TTDPGRITAMLAAHPAGTLAIRTGRVSGLCVVDIDPRNGGTIDRELMTPTATVATGGGGWHLYYHHPGTPVSAKLPDRPGRDIKAGGGYVVAPPSIHPAPRQPYRWVGGPPVVEMAPALVRACQPIPALTVTAPTSPTRMRRAGAISSPAALLTSILASV